MRRAFRDSQAHGIRAGRIEGEVGHRAGGIDCAIVAKVPLIGEDIGGWAAVPVGIRRLAAVERDCHRREAAGILSRAHLDDGLWAGIDLTIQYLDGRAVHRQAGGHEDEAVAESEVISDIRDRKPDGRFGVQSRELSASAGTGQRAVGIVRINVLDAGNSSLDHPLTVAPAQLFTDMSHHPRFQARGIGVINILSHEIDRQTTLADVFVRRDALIVGLPAGPIRTGRGGVFTEAVIRRNVVVGVQERVEAIQAVFQYLAFSHGDEVRFLGVACCCLGDRHCVQLGAAVARCGADTETLDLQFIARVCRLSKEGQRGPCMEVVPAVDDRVLVIDTLAARRLQELEAGNVLGEPQERD